MAPAEANGVAAALLLDADNVSDASSIDRAIEALVEKGWRLTVRRAYGGHEKLAGMKECLLRHGIRAFVNQGKGTTDALLVVDVMDLLHGGRLPEIAVIVSSDGDFAPLATRLREAGKWVLCLAQQGKSAGEELAKAYDELIYLGAEPTRRLLPPTTPSAPRAATARKAAARKAPAGRRADSDDPVRAALEQLPGFSLGQWLELNDAVKALRDAQLLGRSASGPKFLAKNAPWVELAPAAQPHKLRLKAAGSR